jgi:hypothetical protein
MKPCCFGNCPHPATVYLGASPTGDSEMEWMCQHHEAYCLRIQARKREQDEMDKAIAYLDPGWEDRKVL